MGTTILTPTGLQHPDTTGAGVPWATGYIANLTVLNNYLRGYLKRVDTDAWEAPQTGVEYYAPPPYNLYGTKARARRFTGSGAATVQLIASGIDKPLGLMGYAADSSGPTIGVGYGANTSFGFGIYTQTAALNLGLGSSIDDAGDSYDIIAFYVIS